MKSVAGDDNRQGKAGGGVMLYVGLKGALKVGKSIQLMKLTDYYQLAEEKRRREENKGQSK